MTARDVVLRKLACACLGVVTGLFAIGDTGLHASRVPTFTLRSSAPGRWTAPAAARVARAVPTGLTESQWVSIRPAYERDRHQVVAESLRWVVDDDGARYPLTIDLLAQQAYLKASNTDSANQFGESVAISGDTMVMGASWERSSSIGVNSDQTQSNVGYPGAAYVFTRIGEAWVPQAYLKASNTDAQDHFGRSVAISGDTIVVGAVAEDSKATGVNGDQENNNVRDSGAAYVFTRTSGVWTQQAYLKASNTGADDLFGQSVAISGDTIVVGANTEASNATGVNGDQENNSAPRSGAAYVFTRIGGVWTQQAYLKASNTGDNDFFGQTVAISGDTLVVGAPGESSNATGVDGDQMNNDAVQSGAAYVFIRSGGLWTQQAYFKASNTDPSDFFGYGVAISGDRIVVGAPREKSHATGVDGDQTNNDAPLAGATYVFARTGAAWAQQSYVKASNTDAGDFFGASVAVSGETLVVGALFEASSATGVDGDQTNNDASEAGAAYVFTTAMPLTISSLIATPNVLWPPNHKMVNVSVGVSASDASGVAPVCQITAVSSSEPDTVPREGDSVITGPRTVQLRAERTGWGNGRIYTITVTCRNAAGLSATKDVTVRVPHDQSK